MKVPINPQTRVPTGQLGYEKVVDVSSGTRALGAVVSRYAESIAEDNRKRELFEVQKLLVDETNNIQLDFEDKVKIQPLGAPNFTEQVNGIYNTRHAEMVEDLRERGYSEDAVQEFATRLGTIRSQYVAKAIDFQDKSNFAKVLNNTEQLVIGLSQIANKNPGSVGSALNELRVALQHSGLDEIEQERVYENRKGVILQGAREGFALQYPEIVLSLYGAPGETKTEENVKTGELVNLGEAQKTVSTELSNAGFNSNVIAGFLGNFHIENGYTGKSGDGGTAGGIAQWRKERRANFKAMFGEDPTQASIEDQVKFVIWEMQNPKEAGMTVAQRDAILKAKTPAEAAELIDKYYERSNGKARNKRVEAAVAFVSAHAEGTVEKLTETNYGDIARLGAPGSRAAAIGFQPTQPKVELSPAADSPIQTGIPILDLSSGPERMQMLTVARTIMNGREADAKATQRANHEAWLNNFLNDLQDGKLGQNDLNKAYETGLITDFDERKKAQGILDEKNKVDKDLVLFSAMLRQGGKFNPYDDKAQAAVDAGFAKAVELTQKSGENASPFVIALRAWQRTGILPKQGAVMIRGGLIRTDPATVAASASVASNMLAQNSNAFAGVEGGEEIGMKAANYAHYVDDLGLTAEEAAQKIAIQNSPEFQAKVRANEPARNAFQKSLVGDAKSSGVNVESIINNSIFGTPGPGGIKDLIFGTTRGTFTAPQRAEAKQTFTELALDHYDKYSDPEAAQAYASRQISRFYGVEGGRLLKYPATKAYPEIQGNREYIFDQAKGFVDRFVGFEVPKEDIYLQPTGSGSTAAAFRAGKPPPYEVHYITRENGQAVYHFIPGKVFVADVNEARRAAAITARKTEQELRKARKALANVGRMR